MSCIYLYEKVESQLYNKLFEIIGEEQETKSAYAYFKEPGFIEIFGEYQIGENAQLNDKSISDRTDLNGEPKLLYNKNLNKYYFLDSDFEPIFYPYNQGLSQYLTTNDIKSFSKILALKFYDSNIDFNFETLDFSNENVIKLEEFIKTFTNQKASELSNDEDFLKQFKGDALSSSLKYSKEWVKEVKDFFGTLKINIKEEESTEQETEIRGETFRKESFLKSSKNNVNNNVKLFLSLLKSTDVNDFNEFDFIPFDDIYATLNKKLANKLAVNDGNGNLEDIYELFLEEILNVAKVKPYLHDLHTLLTSSDVTELFKNQFVAAFNLYTKNYLGSEISILDGELYYDVRNLSEVSSRKNTIISLWNYNNKKAEIKEGQYKYVLQELNKIQNKFNPGNTTDEEFNKYLEDTRDLLKMIGVVITEQGLNYYLGDNKNNGLSKLLLNTSRGITTQLEDVTAPNIFTSQSIFKELAEAEAFFMQEGSDASIFTLGKTKWMYSNPSYLERRVKGWQKNIELLRQHYESSPFYKGSTYMAYYLKNPEKLQEIEVGVFNSVQRKGDSINASDTKNLSYTDALVDYTNKLLAFKKGQKIWHKTALAADKGTEYQVKYGDDTNVFAKSAGIEIVDNYIHINKDVVDIFYNYFKAEYNRIAYAHQEIENGIEDNLINFYHLKNKNALKSQIFPSLSISFDNNGKVVLPTIEGVTLYDEVGKPIYQNLDQIKTSLLPHITTSLQNGIKNTNNILLSNNIITTDTNGVLQNIGIDSHVFNKYTEEAGQDRTLATMKIAGDIFVNSVISQVEYSMMFTGDTAYYKNMADYKKRVPATYTDGIYLRLQSGEEEFNAAVISSVEVPAPNLEELEKILPTKIYNMYKSVNATDAQAWITPERWKFLMERLGKYDETAKSVYKKFNQVNPEFTTAELKLTAQPLKGVYFDIINGKPVFLKYSQAVLLPNVIKGTPLQKLYDAMTTKNGKTLAYSEQVHELITEDGVKVGLPKPTVSHTEDGGVVDNLVLRPFTLSNSGWKLQQDLPTKGIKPTDVGSQIQKNIFQGLAFNTDKIFELNNEEITGQGLIDNINNIYGAMSSKGVTSLFTRLGINPTTREIENEDALYDNLVKQLKRRNDVPSNFLNALQAKTSPYGIPGAFTMFQNVFSAIFNDEIIKIKTNGGGFIQMTDYGLSKTEAKAKGMIFTPWFAENETRLSPPVLGINPITGKEIIQPGGIFLSGSLIAKYIPNYKELSSEKLFGTYNKETNTYEGGRIDQRILSNIVGYRIPNQGLASNDALQVMGILPEEIGDTVIAYTGITTKTGSDFDIDKMFLMIPSFFAQYTKEVKQQVFNFLSSIDLRADEARQELHFLGKDTTDMNTKEVFDILSNEIIHNKAYPLHEEFLTSTVIKSARKLIYAEADKDTPLHELDLAVLQNRLIESYKAVLTSPHNIADIMNPIDVAFIKDDIKNLVDQEDEGDLMAFSAISDLKLKNEFNLGKAGLGQNINSLVDAVRGSMADLYLNNHYLGWGLSNKEGNTTFDAEFSETLSQQEIKDYMESYNEGISESDHISIEDVKALSSVKLNESMMGLVNGFVDIAKDSYIVQGNWVTQTNNLGFMLLRAGVHPLKVNTFMAQPILREYVQFVTNQESAAINENFNLKLKFKLQKASQEAAKLNDVVINGVPVSKQALFNELINVGNINRLQSDSIEPEEYDIAKAAFFNETKRKVITKFGITKENVNPEIRAAAEKEISDIISLYESIFETKAVDFNTISFKDLRNQIKGEDTIDVQLSVLNQFLEWQDTAKQLSRNVKASKIDVDGKGKNITSLITSINLIQNIKSNEENDGAFGGFTSKLYKDGKETMLNHALKNGLTEAYYIMQANPKFFLTANPTTVNTFNLISKFLYGTRLENTTLGDKLEKDYYTYIMSGFPPLSMEAKDMTYLLEELPDQFLEVKGELKDNLLLNELAIKESDVKDEFFISMPNIKRSTSFKNSLTDSWSELLETHPKFAEDLIRYAFLTSGFNNSINQFHDYIPYQWFNKNRFNSYLKSLSLHSGKVDRIFVNQFFRNNTKDAAIVKTVFPRDMVPFGADGFNAAYTTKKEVTQPPYLTVREDVTEETVIKRYYQLEGINNNNQAVYTRTSPLGKMDNKANKVIEYNINHTNGLVGMGTLFESNRRNFQYINSELIRKIQSTYSGTVGINTDDIVTKIEALRISNNPDYKIDEKEVVENLDNSEKSDTFVNIYAGSGENAELSNFANRPFIPDGGMVPKIEYNNVESAFQHVKLTFADPITDQPLEVQSAQWNRLSGSQAKKLGRKIIGLQTEEWDDQSGLIMEEFILESFEQNPDALQKLLATGNAVLTHTQDKGKWGKLFPQILMKVREELSKEELPEPSLIQPLNDRVDIQYPEYISVKDSLNVELKLDTKKLMELSELPHTNIIPFKEGIPYADLIEEKYGDIAATYVAETGSEISVEEAEFIKNNREFSVIFMDEYLASEEGDSIQDFAKRLLDNSNKIYIDKNQLGFDFPC